MFLIFLILLINPVNVLKTHFISESFTGFKNLNKRDLSFTLKHDNLLTEAETILKLQKPVIAGIFADTAWTDIPINPAYALMLQCKSAVTKILNLITQIKTYLPQIAGKRKRAIDDTCVLEKTIYKDMYVSESLLGINEVLTKIVSLVNNHKNLATHFHNTDDFQKVCLLLHSVLLQIEQILAYTQTFANNIIALDSNLIPENIRIEILGYTCFALTLSNYHSLSNIKCDKQTNKLVCKTLLTTGEQKVELKLQLPYIFNQCYVDKTLLLDDNNKSYDVNSKIPIEQDICTTGLLSQNITIIRKNCPLKRSNLKLQFTGNNLIIHQLTAEISRQLTAAAIPIEPVPFKITGSTKLLTFSETTYQWSFTTPLSTYHPTLAFSPTLLCPLDANVAEKTDIQTYLQQNSLEILINIGLTISTLFSLQIILKTLVYLKNMLTCATRPNREQRLRHRAQETLLLNRINQASNRRR